MSESDPNNGPDVSGGSAPDGRSGLWCISLNVGLCDHSYINFYLRSQSTFN
jgi:hypothetical protein